jgi:hypothetical protein
MTALSVAVRLLRGQRKSPGPLSWLRGSSRPLGPRRRPLRKKTHRQEKSFQVPFKEQRLPPASQQNQFDRPY